LGLNHNQLDAIEIFSLKNISVVGGNVMHGIKNSDEGFEGFGEAYFSWIEPYVVKAWKKHLKMTMNLIVPLGKVKFVFYCSASKKFRMEEIGKDNYCRVKVPAGIWFGFMGIDEENSLILNVASCLHDPQEVTRLDIKEINYNWTRQ
tara:strand:+ start:1321 stop:1761 length:441 start_codon:yes stop_codon:yes gene_type:complete